MPRSRKVLPPPFRTFRRASHFPSRLRQFLGSELPEGSRSCWKTALAAVIPSSWRTIVKKFMAAAGRRPELAGLMSSYLPNAPQEYVDVDRAKVVSEAVNIGDVYQTMQTFMGGYLVNYFNRFGRQWQVYVEADGDYRTRAAEYRAVLCDEQPAAAAYRSAR